MRGKGITVAAAAVAVFVLTGQGCEDQATPSMMMDGAHTITKSMRGFWDSPGGTGCTWSKKDRYGNKTASGSGSRSQTVLISTADVGGQFRSNHCKRWEPK